MQLKCKACKKTQDSTRLDRKHIYCLAHTSDANEQGIGLVCLNVRSRKESSGVCPDCGRISVETKDGCSISYTVGTNGQRENIIEL